MISGETEANQIAQTRLILQMKFGHNPLFVFHQNKVPSSKGKHMMKW